MVTCRLITSLLVVQTANLLCPACVHCCLTRSHLCTSDAHGLLSLVSPVLCICKVVVVQICTLTFKPSNTPRQKSGHLKDKRPRYKQGNVACCSLQFNAMGNAKEKQTRTDHLSCTRLFNPVTIQTYNTSVSHLNTQMHITHLFPSNILTIIIIIKFYFLFFRLFMYMYTLY